MSQYLLSIFHGEGAPPPTEVLSETMQRVGTLNQELQSAGAWVFAGGLNPSTTAITFRPEEGGLAETEGPFNHDEVPLSGCWIIDVKDLDAALEWGRKAATACGLPVEVRSFQDMA
ncbi:MAG: YciI family protein [Candidatus Dormiibacterota bacterium]